jgi:hypothetical protein
MIVHFRLHRRNKTKLKNKFSWRGEKNVFEIIKITIERISSTEKVIFTYIH